uniref:DUF7789 domain-containing protein n=1 Tax=Xiphophorus couchianus TaxID=32473 RepID=A0A3B5KZR5_9TELE
IIKDNNNIDPICNNLLSPNLRPRHQSLIPTPCGPIKSWSELSALVKTYFCFTVVSLLALLSLTVSKFLLLCFPSVFCIYYISRGVLQENRQELVAFVLSVLVVMIRSVVNFSVVASSPKENARFVCIMCLGVIHVLCTTVLIQRPNMMAFRVGGALESMQEQYFLLNLCFSMVTFDLQAQLCLCILITTSASAMSAANTIILGVGVFWAFVTAVVGAVAVLKEAKVLVWVFMVQNLPEVAFFIYLLYSVIEKWFHDQTYTLEAATVTGALISLLIKGVLLWGLIRLVQSFGQGLRERSEP